MPTPLLNLPTPAELTAAIPATSAITAHVAAARAAIEATMAGHDRRLLVILGPCSIHDSSAAIEYAQWLGATRRRFDSRLLLVMRAYVEKARTRLGWKGLLNDPDLDGSGRVAEGLRLSRALLAEINTLGIPVATEFIGPGVPAYLVDLVSWAAVGARTVESPSHREMASGLPCPIGFKNTIDGRTAPAINAMLSTRVPHQLLGADRDGRLAVTTTLGNARSHLVLRGGGGSNYGTDSVRRVIDDLRADHLLPRVVIDCGHGNCGGDYRNQLPVGLAVADQIARDRQPILGVMFESHLHEGAQSIEPGRPLAYGVSVTDGCLGPADTVTVLEAMFEAMG